MSEISTINSAVNQYVKNVKYTAKNFTDESGNKCTTRTYKNGVTVDFVLDKTGKYEVFVGKGDKTVQFSTGNNTKNNQIGVYSFKNDHSTPSHEVKQGYEDFSQVFDALG